MGLEAFKTDGPRTRSKKSSNTAEGDDDAVHVLDGIDVDELDVPDGIPIHTVERYELAEDVTATSFNYFITCRKCKATSESYETKLKVDKLDYRDTDWYDEFMRTCIELAPTEHEDTSDESDDSGSGTSHGLSAFK